MTFPDHFSPVAAQYATSRPHYPDTLFTWLASLCATRHLAWDAGCGSGQAAVGLADHFTRVVATDPSAKQLASAEPRRSITYDVGAERNPRLVAQCADLVTVAQALHWFDRPTFYRDVERVLAPQGVLAVWTYDLALVDEAVDEVVHAWYRETLGPYWPPERAHTETRYRDIGFPYPLIETPSFDMTQRWTRTQFVAYLRTWSAVTVFATRTGGDALTLVLPQLEMAWPDDAPRLVRWPLTVLAGRRQ